MVLRIDFLRGPMLPIYGFGAVLLLHVSLPLYDRPAALFFASMAAATVFEYIVGVVMEKLFKVKYWDYSEHRFQFRGYICLQSSLCWGFLGLILARFIHRPVEWVIAALPFRALLAVDVLWSAAFLADVIVSVRAALDLARVLEELDRLREQGAELRQELSETALTRLTNLSYRVEEAAGELAERTRDAREEAQARTAAAAMRAADLREDIEQRLDEAKDELAERTRDASPGTPPMSARIFRTVWTSFSAALTSALRVSAARAGACCAATRPPVRHSTTQFSRS